MQLPDHLLRTYRRYKTEERDLLNWICATAEQVGHVLSRERSTVSSKLKGRDRVKARRAAEKRTTAADINHCEAPQIAIFDILPSVKAIAQSTKIVWVPAGIANNLLDILKLRRRCLHWYRSNTSQYDEETRLANKKHEYPVFVLEQALGILRHKFTKSVFANAAEPNIPPAPKLDVVTPVVERKKPADVAQARGAAVISEVFESISSDIEGRTDNKPAATVDVKSSTSNTMLTPELSEEDRMQEEYNLAQYCLYQDTEQIEDYLMLEIVRYALDQGNSDVLPYLINTAVDMVQKMVRSIDACVQDSKKCKIIFSSTYWRTTLRLSR